MTRSRYAIRYVGRLGIGPEPATPWIVLQLPIDRVLHYSRARDGGPAVADNVRVVARCANKPEAEYYIAMQYEFTGDGHRAD